MAELFIVIKRKGSKKILGAIPIRNKAKIKKMAGLVPKSIKSRYDTKIVNKTQLKNIISRLSPKGKRVVRKKKTTRKRTNRRRK